MMKKSRHMALMPAVMLTLSLFGAQRTVEVGSACKLVDPFWGCGGTTSAPSEGMARGWNWEKAQTGNTHPGAVRPFGWVSVCAYTGGYSSGYGRYGVSGGGTPPEKLKTMQGFGFTHFHNNGAGWIWHFLNMFLFTPSAGDADLSSASAIVDEKATPGYYAATLSDYGAAFELTADRFAACHRYRFTRGKGRLRVDLTQLGFRGDIFGGRKGYKETIEKPEIRATGDGAWMGSIRVYGIRLHFGLIAKGGVTSSSVKDGVLELGFSGSTAETAIGFSDACAELAVQRTQAAAARGFDRVRADAAATWESLLGTVRPAFAKESDVRRFYSTLYQSTTKPSEFREGRFTEFQTLWDMYRTQVPLALTLCPDYSRRILESMLATSEQIGYFPVAYLFQRKNSHNLGEASVLGAYSVADGCFLGLLGKDDYPRVKAFFLREFRDVKLDGKSVTHRLDLAGALRAAAWVAEANGDVAQAKEWLEQSAIWKTAYNLTNGYLQVGNHYEGTEKNYSFRPHVGMKERIALAGGATRFETMMDDFFAVNDDFSKWTPARDRVSRKGKFEGLNNESDMNAPCTWLWCGRLDRLAEVHDLVRRCRFADGEGGCPGNNDGGGTSSWYVWSCLGLYPLSGTPYCLLVSPTVESAEIPFGTGRLSIAVTRESAKSIYPVGFTFNGRSFKEPWLPLKDLTKGGLLEFRLADRPQGKSPVPDWL